MSKNGGYNTPMAPLKLSPEAYMGRFFYLTFGVNRVRMEIRNK